MSERADFGTRFSSTNQPVSNGRPKGARDRLSTKLIETLASDFEERGALAIEAAREKDPVGYLRICAIVVPKQVEHEHKFLAEATDDQVEAMYQEWKAQREAAKAQVN
jgi:hypothetical protein